MSVEEFIAANELDEMAAGALREIPEEAQALVIGRGDLSSARNKSSALMSRIRGTKAAMNFRAPTEPKGPLIGVEEFIAVNELDDKAANALREIPEEAQNAVIARGDLSSPR